MSISISRIVMLVHPLYSVFHASSTLVTPGQKPDLALSRKNISFLLGIWGNQMKLAARSPNTLVIVVKYDPRIDKTDLIGTLPTKDPVFRRKVAWISTRLNRFYHHIESHLGKRVVFVTNEMGKKDIPIILKERGLLLRKHWTGRTFGEYFDRCVKNQAANLRHAGVGTARGMVAKPYLSVGSLNPDSAEKMGLGSMRENLRRNYRLARATNFGLTKRRRKKR